MRDSSGQWCANEDLNHPVTTYYYDIFSSQGVQIIDKLDDFSKKISHEIISISLNHTHMKK